jgi:hypothetical protein
MLDFEIIYTEDIFEVEEYHLPIIESFKNCIDRAVSNSYRLTTRIVATFNYYPNEMKFELVGTDKKNTIYMIERVISMNREVKNFTKNT